MGGCSRAGGARRGERRRTGPRKEQTSSKGTHGTSRARDRRPDDSQSRWQDFTLFGRRSETDRELLRGGGEGLSLTVDPGIRADVEHGAHRLVAAGKGAWNLTVEAVGEDLDGVGLR